MSKKQNHTLLNSKDAFSSGADVWILANKEVSKWNLKLDWYLDFQITNTRNKTPVPLSKELSQMLSENDLEKFEFHHNKKDSLMISSQNHLPNKITLEICFDGNIDSWKKEILNVTSKLNQHKLRVFLPENIDLKEFLKTPFLEKYELVSS